jgi:hypothetical protein
VYIRILSYHCRESTFITYLSSRDTRLKIMSYSPSPSLSTPLVRVLEIRREDPFSWCSLLQNFPSLFEVDLGVARWHLYCAEVIEVAGHRIIVNVAIGVLNLEPMYDITVDKFEMEEGASVLAHSIDREGHACGDALLQQEGVYIFVKGMVPTDGVCFE